MCPLKFDQHPESGKNPMDQKMPIALSPALLAIQYAEVLWLREQVCSYEARQNPSRPRLSNHKTKATCDRSLGATEVPERHRSRSKT
jgi:hypothetical protein